MGAPVRRVLAIDAGTRNIRLLLAGADFRRLHILRQEVVDVAKEGLTTPEETKAYFHAILGEWGSPPVVMVLPQHLSTSHAIDLPVAPDVEVKKLIGDEAVKLGGVSESRIIYDFVRTHAETGGRQQFWVTLAQEGDIRDRLARFGVEGEQLCEVTTTANALIAAFRAASPDAERALLVHIGAQTTVLIIVIAGQGGFATSFQMGGDFFTRSLARQLSSPEDQAEVIRHSKNLLLGPDASPAFIETVDGWVTEFDQQLREWFRSHPGASGGFDVISSGGGFNQPGLRDYLNRRTGLDIRDWPASGSNRDTAPQAGFEVAYGAALQALGRGGPSPSLLPEDYRQAWKRYLNLQRLERASLVMALLILMLLGLGIWKKVNLIEAKQGWLAKIKYGQELFELNRALRTDLANEYNLVRPVFAQEQQTVDTLRVFGLLQQSRSNRAFWFVLLADQQSYFSYPPASLTTNRPPSTNAAAITVVPLRISAAPEFPATNHVTGTNSVSPRSGFIAELTVPEDAEAARKTLRELVGQLGKQETFSRADLLSDDLRRELADHKVILPDRHFALRLDLARTEFNKPVPGPAPIPVPGPAPASTGLRGPVKRMSGNADAEGRLRGGGLEP